DVASLETQRGGLSANYGDRAYGVFNVVPRSGFEDHRFGDLFLGYGSYHRAEGYASVGDHNASERFAYFASGHAHRTELGLERVALPLFHDEGKTASGFPSLQYNATSRDHLRFVASFRADRNQVPNIVAQEAIGIDDNQRTADGIANFTWARTYEGGTL